MLAYRLAAAIALGVGTGVLAGPRAAPLGEIAVGIIQILKALAAPLVFLAVAEACSRIDIRWMQGVRLLTISLINAVVAGGIALTLDHLIPVQTAGAETLRAALLTGAKGATETTAKAVDLSLSGVIEGLLPKSVVQPFAENQVIGAVVLALFVGLALRKAKEHAGPEAKAQLETVDAFLSGASRVVMIGIGWIVAVVPIAVFGVLAKVVGQTGFTALRPLAFFLGVVCIGFVLHGVVYYSALLATFTRRSPREFFGLASDALLTAFGTGSSLATMPVTLETLQGKMGVRPENARLAAMVGTNLNHDGILLYEAAAALFVARVIGVPLDGGQQVLVVAISAIAAFGIGGVPDAGLLTLSLVLSTLKLPLAAVPLLLPLDWLIGRMRATLNVTSDLVVANLLETWDARAARRTSTSAAMPAETPRESG